jgi:NAD-specific glutamate dehydrogenase
VFSPHVDQTGTPSGRPLRVVAWAKSQEDALERTRTFLNILESSGVFSVAKLMLASSHIQNLD